MATIQPVGKDLFFRAPGDPNYHEGLFESRDTIENAIQQVRMTLLTRPGEVLGEDIGFNPEKYLFDFEGANISTLTSEANEQIAEYVVLAKPLQISAKAFNIADLGNPYHIGLGLDVLINGTTAFATLFDL